MTESMALENEGKIVIARYARKVERIVLPAPNPLGADAKDHWHMIG